METKTQEITRRRFTVHEYHRMAEVGILHEDDRVELIEGEIVDMTPIGSRHFACVNRLTRLLVRAVSDDAVVSIQNPVRLGERHEPQPDAAVIRTRDYRDTLPGPEDILLLIEVADTSLAYDRNVKLPLYAQAGIPEVWIVDLASETIERHTNPSGNDYRHIEKVRRGETFESTALSGLSIRTSEVLG